MVGSPLIRPYFLEGWHWGGSYIYILSYQTQACSTESGHIPDSQALVLSFHLAERCSKLFQQSLPYFQGWIHYSCEPFCPERNWNKSGQNGGSWNPFQVKNTSILFGLSPLPVTVTTRIITFLVGDPYKPSFATVTGRGDNPTYCN